MCLFVLCLYYLYFLPLPLLNIFQILFYAEMASEFEKSHFVYRYTVLRHGYVMSLRTDITMSISNFYQLINLPLATCP